MRNYLLVSIIILFGCPISSVRSQDCVTQRAFYPQAMDTFVWTEQEIIDIISQGEVLFCRTDEIMIKDDSSFFVKDMEIMLSKDPIFISAYLESSLLYGDGKKDQKKAQCEYLLLFDREGNKLELTENELKDLPLLSWYLSKKIQKARINESYDEIPDYD